MIKISDAIELLSGILDTADNRKGCHLTLDDDRFTDRYCDNNCPAIWDGRTTCDGRGCRDWEYSLQDAERKVSAADILIEAVLTHGYWALRLDGIAKPCDCDEYNTVNMNWEHTYEGDMSFCKRCELIDKPECPEDMFSEKCPYHKSVWAIGNIAETVDEMI